MRKLHKALLEALRHAFPFVSDGAIPATNCLSNDALFKVQSDVIRRLAEEKSCVFVGRCADYILRDNPRCVNVFISCSNEERIKRLCRMHSISEREAEEMMNKADKKRAEYYNYYSYKKWGLPRHIICVSIPLYWELRERRISSRNL